MPLSNQFGEAIFRATVAVPGDNEATIIPLGTSVATQRPYKYALDGMQLQAGDDVYVIPISGTYVLLGGAVAGGGGSLPAGGAAGDVLVKNGAADYAAKWTNTPPQMGSLATIEPTSSASKAYAAGDYLVYNGQLYKVTASTISQGQTLDPTPGSGNIEAANIGSAVSDITSKYSANVRVLTVATNASQSGFSISVPSDDSCVVLYCDIGGRAALITKYGGGDPFTSPVMLASSFTTVSINGNAISVGTGRWTRAIMIITATHIDLAEISVY